MLTDVTFRITGWRRRMLMIKYLDPYPIVLMFCQLAIKVCPEQSKRLATSQPSVIQEKPQMTLSFMFLF